MGDRANIAVKQPDGGFVYLYTHNGGYKYEDDLRSALDKHARWDDGAYLTRIIFDQMTKDAYSWETGYGISTSIQDNGHPIIYVDPMEMIVSFTANGGEHRMSFRDFLASPSFELGSVYEY